jgi:hypothetical protein
MGSDSNRDEFTSATKASLAKRSGFLCAICRAITTGPSAESADSVVNLGVAAHITAASPGGPRYDPSLSSSERSSITNGIWLCQNHAKQIDDDCEKWTQEKLRSVKNDHEEFVERVVGVPQLDGAGSFDISEYDQSEHVTPREYAFTTIGDLGEVYRSVISPMIRDCELEEEDQVGILMCGTPPDEAQAGIAETPWTVFVDPEWLQWYLDGRSSGFETDREVPTEQIYGQIPAWPDSFFDFLEAMVRTDTTFEWNRHSNGYLILSQQEL